MPLLKSPTGEQHSGKELVETLMAPDGKVLYSAKHKVNPDSTLETTEENWHHEPLKSLNQDLLKGVEPKVGVAGAVGDAAATAVAAGKLVLCPP